MLTENVDIKLSEAVMYPLSRTVVIIGYKGKWYLSNGWQFAGPYSSSDSAFEDQKTISTLYYNSQPQDDQKESA